MTPHPTHRQDMQEIRNQRCETGDAFLKTSVHMHKRNDKQEHCLAVKTGLFGYEYELRELPPPPHSGVSARNAVARALSHVVPLDLRGLAHAPCFPIMAQSHNPTLVKNIPVSFRFKINVIRSCAIYLS